MAVREFYERSVAIGIDLDLRGRDVIQADLSALRAAYERLPAAALAQAGVNTALMVTPGEPLIRAAQEHDLSIIGLPHEGQDSLGMSLLYAKVIDGEEVTIYPCGGYLVVDAHFQ